MRTLALLSPFALLALPQDALAFGVGTTAYFGSDFGVWRGGFFDFDRFGGVWLPSLDLYPTDDLLIQIHALDTLAWLVADTDVIFIGANIHFTVYRAPALKGTEGIIAPGVSLDIYDIDSDAGVVLGLTSRFGIEGGDGVRVGAYVVPGFGVAAGGGVWDDGAVWSGSVQTSIWFQ